jgi:tRNA A37 threonylcarbamoyladenosine synthetase subunit TsaC/SUA5/YrdC
MDSDLIYLVQTDTTVGFLSQNSSKLSSIKERPSEKKFILSVDSFETLSTIARVPKKHRVFVRNRSKTSFVIPKKDFSFRVIPNNHPHSSFVKKFKTIYSTSANITGERFDESFAKAQCDISVINKAGFSEQKPSSIICLYKKRRVKVRS